MARTRNFIRLLIVVCGAGLLSNCKNTQMVSRDTVKILGYSDEDSPVGTVLVTTMGGGAPAVMLAQQLDVQTEDEVTPENPKNIKLDDNEKITFDSLFLFERNSYQITPAMEENLSRIIHILKRHANAIVFIEGYKDSVDIKKSNLTLSDKRAKAIADYMVHHAIKPSRIQAKGYADTQPLFSNKLAQGRIKNRRVEVSVIARSDSERKNSRK